MSGSFVQGLVCKVATQVKRTELNIIIGGRSTVHLVCVGKLSYEIHLEFEDGSVG